MLIPGDSPSTTLKPSSDKYFISFIKISCSFSKVSCLVTAASIESYWCRRFHIWSIFLLVLLKIRKFFKLVLYFVDCRWNIMEIAGDLHLMEMILRKTHSWTYYGKGETPVAKVSCRSISFYLESKWKFRWFSCLVLLCGEHSESFSLIIKFMLHTVRTLWKHWGGKLEQAIVQKKN